MSIYAVCEVLLHFDSFRNIDLFQQGWYHVRARLYSEKSRSPGVPITHFRTSSHGTSATLGPAVNAVQACLDTEKMTFSCRTFSVMYCDDRGDLGDVGYFRIELETQKDLNVEPVIVDFELMFCSAGRKTPPANASEFERVALHRFRIPNLTRGVHSYVGTLFDEWHLVLCNVMVHSVLLDFRFRANPPLPHIPAEDTPASNKGISKAPPTRSSSRAGSASRNGSRGSATNTTTSSTTSTTSTNNNNNNNTSSSSSNKIRDIERKNKPEIGCSPFCAYYVVSSVRQQAAAPVPSTSLASLLFPTNLYYDSSTTARSWATLGFRKRDNTATPSLYDPEDTRLPSVTPTDLSPRKDSTNSTPLRRSVSDTPTVPASRERIALTPAASPRQIRAKLRSPAQDASDRLAAAFSSPSSTQAVVRHAEQVHRLYTLPLCAAYKRLARKLTSTFAEAPLTVGQRRMLEDTVRLPPLKLPWETSSSSSSSSQPTPNGSRRGLTFVDDGAGEGNTNRTGDDSEGRFNQMLATEMEAPTAEKLAQILVGDMHFIAEQTFDLWRRLMTLCVHCPREICAVLRAKSERKLQLRWAHSVFRDTIDSSVIHGDQESTLELNLKRALALRKGLPTLPTSLEDVSIPTSSEFVPALFQQLHMTNKGPPLKERSEVTVGEVSGEISPASFSMVVTSPKAENISSNSNKPLERSSSVPLQLNDIKPALSASRAYGDGHLIVFVHGFQGNSFDLRLFRDYLQLQDTRAEFLMSSANENERTTGDFRTMGLALAREVHDYIQRNSPSFRLQKLSFVGHSIGGVIIRAALVQPPLKQYLPCLQTYVSLSAAHLGYMYAANGLLSSAMWFLRTVKKCKSVQQLCLLDATPIKQSFLYELSQSDAMRNFKHIVLVSSPQDRYAPYHSARMEMCRDASADEKHGSAYGEMVKGLLHSVKGEQIVRLDVVFGNIKRNLDSAIGRTAHIQLLENRQFIHMFCVMFAKYFE